jgi:hypothetical protein
MTRGTKPEHFAAVREKRVASASEIREGPRTHIRGLEEKYLQRVCAEFVGYFERGGKISGDRCMDSDAGAAVFPSGNFRWRRRFRTILISCVKYELGYCGCLPPLPLGVREPRRPGNYGQRYSSSARIRLNNDSNGNPRVPQTLSEHLKIAKSRG